MVGEQGRLRVDGVRAHAGRGILAALVVATAFAPVATANGGRDNGNGGGGNARATESHGNGAKHEQNAGSNGNRADEGQRAHSEGRRAHGEGRRVHGEGQGHGQRTRGQSQSGGSGPKRASSPANEDGNHRNGASEGRKHGNSSESGEGNRGAAHQKTTICHATGSETNPYVQITISDRALAAHRRHQDGEDIIPAPAGGCPGSAAIVATTDQAAQHAFAGTTPPAPGAAAGTGTPAAPAPPADNAVAGATESGTPAPDAGTAAQHEVRGVVESSDDAADNGAVAPAGASTGAGDDGSTGPLPFTGLELALVCLAGALLTAAGFALRRTVATRA